MTVNLNWTPLNLSIACTVHYLSEPLDHSSHVPANASFLTAIDVHRIRTTVALAVQGQPSGGS